MTLSPFSFGAALVLAVVSLSQPAAAAGSTTRSKAVTQKAPAQKAPAPLARPQAPAQDQSYLFLSGPKEGRGAPDYVTAGMKHSNQPWFMTRYDRLGNWP
ncbi:hypothetical protein [uncultured Alsobacter sp.]|uniref:hypothetical protein n=1 Tax=uncultured Alsobacter sp. TaxID=1748258 RepID=UPI0026006448|nr:hypothetical protein [uncultured Alsobacter sp.]